MFRNDVSMLVVTTNNFSFRLFVNVMKTAVFDKKYITHTGILYDIAEKFHLTLR